MGIAKMVRDKRRWRRYKQRTAQLPDGYRSAVDGLERYLMYFGPSGETDSLLRMLDDLVDLFEQSAADRTPVRAVVGEDPVEFAEQFLRNYPGRSWIDRERDRLTSAIDRATDKQKQQ